MLILARAKLELSICTSSSFFFFQLLFNFFIRQYIQSLVNLNFTVTLYRFSKPSSVSSESPCRLLISYPRRKYHEVKVVPHAGGRQVLVCLLHSIQFAPCAGTLRSGSFQSKSLTNSVNKPSILLSVII